MRHPNAGWLIPLIGLIVLLAGCREQGEALPFETVIPLEGSFDSGWDNPEPGLLVITTLEEGEAAEALLDPFDQITPDVTSIDFQTHLALIMFCGSRGVGIGGQKINQVRLQDRTMMIAADYCLPAGEGPDVAASPFHLIKLERRGEWQGVFRFEVYFDGERAPSLVVEDRMP